MIEVLWIDDECWEDKYTGFIEMAYGDGDVDDKDRIKITAMSTYKEGIDAIEQDPSKWKAVILDIRDAKETTGKPSKGFSRAYNKIITINNNNQKEPYIFVLSGEKQYQTESFVIDKPEYCRKEVYEKTQEGCKLLFEDIRNITNVSELFTCKKQYEDVLDIAKFCGEETEKRLLILLYKITVENIRNNPAFLNDMRKTLEDIMAALKRLNYPYFAEAKEHTLNSFSYYIDKETNEPEYIKRAFHTLGRIVQEGSHSQNVNAPKFTVDHDVLNSKAPYLLRSCIYELCNILIWMQGIKDKTAV